MNESIFNKIKSISKQEKKTFAEKGLKLVEEVGELSAEILKLNGRKGAKGKSRDEIRKEALFEVADVHLVLATICTDLGYTHE